jgi:hypothetical protein
MKIVKAQEKKITLGELSLGTVFQFIDYPDYTEWSPSRGEDADFPHDLFYIDSAFMLIEQRNRGDDNFAIVVDLESGLPYLIEKASITNIKIPSVEPFLTIN